MTRPFCNYSVWMSCKVAMDTKTLQLVKANAGSCLSWQLRGKIQDGRNEETIVNTPWILKLCRETWNFSDLWGDILMHFYLWVEVCAGKWDGSVQIINSQPPVKAKKLLGRKT